MSRSCSTTFAKVGNAKNWYVIDAKNMVVGRLASQIALLLRGKHKADFTPHIDTGDHVVVINAKDVVLTGKKRTNDVFYWHTGYPGGIKQRTKEEMLSGKYPERVLQNAVRRMMPKESPLARKQLSKLKIYPGSEHAHQAQSPISLDLATKNKKNKR